MSLSREVSNRIKGIAIVLMVMTHTFKLFSSGSSYFTIPFLNTGKTLETILGQSADICVYLFAFVSGYGLCCSYKGKNAKDIFFQTLTKIIQFLLCYWLIVFAIYLPFYAANQGNDFRFIELFKTMFGHQGFFSYGWYVYFYLLLLVTLPLFGRLLNLNKCLSLVVSYLPFIGAYIILNRVQTNVPYYDNLCVLLFSYCTACVGYSFAKHGFFDFVNNLFSRKRWIIMLITGIVGFSLELIGFGYYGKGIVQPFSVVFIIVFIVELFSFNTPKWLNKALDILGYNSMNMWYIHYIFFCPFIIYYIHSDQWILFSKVGIIAVILGTVISLLISLPFTFINNRFIRKIKISSR